MRNSKVLPPHLSSLAAKLGPGNYNRIAKAAGLTPPHVSRVLRGMRGVSTPVAFMIAKAAGVTMDELYAYISNGGSNAIPHRKTRRELVEGVPVQVYI